MISHFWTAKVRRFFGIRKLFASFSLPARIILLNLQTENELYPKTMTIIGIAGGSGSGKTTVVKRITKALPPHCAAIVPIDS